MVQRRGPQTVVSTVGDVTTATRAPAPPAAVRSVPTPEGVKEPAVLARALKEIHSELDRAHANSASVLSGAVFMRNVALGIGTTYVEHRLGRTPMGVFAALATSGVLGAALPTGYDPARFFAVASTVVQTCSFLVF